MSKTNEAKLYALLKKNLKKVHFVRIESYTENGIPDVNACYNGEEVWLELKANTHKDLGLSKWQKVWIAKRIKAGGTVFIINRPQKERALKIYRGSVVLGTQISAQEQHISVKEPIDWELVQRELFPGGEARVKAR